MTVVNNFLCGFKSFIGALYVVEIEIEIEMYPSKVQINVCIFPS